MEGILLSFFWYSGRVEFVIGFVGVLNDFNCLVRLLFDKVVILKGRLFFIFLLIIIFGGGLLGSFCNWNVVNDKIDGLGIYF